MNTRDPLLYVLLLSFVAWPCSAADKYRNAVGVNITYSQNQAIRGVDEWGLSVDYARALNGPWSVAGGLGWNRERGRADAENQPIDTISVGAAGGYKFRQSRWSAIGYVSRDLYDTNNANGDFRSTFELTFGAGAGYDLWDSERHSLNAGMSIEYQTDAKEWLVQFVLGYAFGF